MFGRKRRVASNPSLDNGPKVDASAQAAAALAFMRPQASNISLSAAAAAAALRARPTAPTSVADVQTKRTIRRANSNSSMGSSMTGSTRGPPGAQLERKGSSGSMTERTFRDPSPNRGSAQPSLDDAPPVPAIPKNLALALPTKPHRRAASMEMPVLPRVASPLHGPANERGSSLESYRGIQPPRRSVQRLSNLASVQELTGVERPNSRGSVNFSYPRGFGEMSPHGQRRLTSPTPSSAKQSLVYGQKQNLVYDPNTRSFLPESELLFYEQNIRDAAERPVRRKKKVASQGAAGTHLASGSIRGRIKGTAVNETDKTNEALNQAGEFQTTLKTANTPVPRRKKADVSGNIYGNEPLALSASDYESDNSEKPTKLNARAGLLLAKKPSVVREDREREEAEDETDRTLDQKAALEKLESGSSDAPAPSPSPILSSSVSKGHGKNLASEPDIHVQYQQHTRSVNQSAPSFSTETTATSTSIPADDVAAKGDTDSTKPTRVQSLSPVRNAHFLTTPESLEVKHQPPARSVSPRKSALKHLPSSRGSSPSGEVPAGVGTNRISSLSELSDSSTAISDERSPKKKSVRVSFDDESNVVLGQSGTPVASDTPSLQGSQGKRSWFSSMSRGKMMDLEAMDDDDEVMKPRPALPSFGSIREKKVREVEERPLVKPTGPYEPTVLPHSSLFTTASSEAIQHPMGQSNDHALGAVLAHDYVSRNVANISKSREPLPPEVTSVEGSGYVSDSGSSVDTTEHTTKSLEKIQQEPKAISKPQDSNEEAIEAPLVQSTPEHEEPEISALKSNGNGTIPLLALTQASPINEEAEDKGQWPFIPGSFPSNSDSKEDESQISIAEGRSIDHSPAAFGIVESDRTVYQVESLPVGGIAAENQHRSPAVIEEEGDESDDSSIYSDAAEDLSDMQGDGFMSLDAVVESPILQNIPGLVITTPSETPTKGFKENVYMKRAASKEPDEPEKDGDWDKAQHYWDGLIAGKREEPERAAREKADEESAEELKPEPKLKAEKKVAVESPPRNSQFKKPQSNALPDRTYQIVPGARTLPDGTVPVMRSSMRVVPQNTEGPAHMRKSMRSSGSMRLSMRGPPESVSMPPQSEASLQKKYRPISTPQPGVRPNPAEARKRVESMSASSAPSPSSALSQVTSRPVPTLRRKGSAESDSSFKRMRPVTEGYSMKRSLRGTQQRQGPGRPQSPELPASTLQSSRFSLRSLSPTRSNYGGTPLVTLGRTLRNNREFSREFNSGPLVPDTKSTLRFPGFGKSKPKPKAKAAPTRASRFADSSDEEEDVRPSFRSRFADSSDEEDEAGPAPTMTQGPTSLGSTARRTNIVDYSSDLEPEGKMPSQPSKSSKVAKFVIPPDKTVTAAQIGNALAPDSLRRSGSGRGFTGGTTTTSVTAGTAARPSQKQRGPFMSILRRKKPDPSSKVRKIDAESAARRDTPLERSRADLKAVRQDSDVSTASEAAGPRLQKRDTTKGALAALENWPLAAPHPDTNGVVRDDVGPHSSDKQDVSDKLLEKGEETAASARPGQGPRQLTATSMADVDLRNVIPPKKKKKFGMLRRAFRLDD